MKKIKLLVAPLLSVAFLASCGGDVKTNPHIVTEQEFNDACSFKDVQYLQLSVVSEESNATVTSLCSPTVYHTVYESSVSYYEQFTRKNDGGTYEKAYRDDKSSEAYTFATAAVTDFYTPQDHSLLPGFEHVGISYNSFTYDVKEGTYSATFIPPEGSEVTKVLRFENKKLVSEADIIAGGFMTTIYAYDEETPEYPENPGPTPTYDEIQIPSVEDYPVVTLHAVNGIIRIKITNATTISPNTNFNAASCNLSDETSEITKSTPKVFSTVIMSYDETTWEFLNYDVFNAESPDMRLQLWSINFESQPTESNIYIIIALNNDYVSSASRTIKQNYTGTVSCSLYNQLFGDAGIEIDYDSITEQPTL